MRLLEVPLQRPIVTPNYRIEAIFTLLCEARHTEGEAGLGALWFLRAGQAKVVMEAVRYLAGTIRSSDPATVTADFRREVNFLGYKGVTVMAMAGLEMALHDLRLRIDRRALGAPARRSTVPIYWSGFYLNDDLEHWTEEAERAIARGFRAFKARVGSAASGEDERRISALRSVLPTDTVLMVDANQAWNPQEAIAAAGRLAKFRIRWLEDPILHNDYRGLAKVVRESSIPIATGENEYLREGFEQLLDARVPYLLGDLERVGGFEEWDAVAAMALESGAILTSHLYPHVALRLCAGLDQRENWAEYVDWWEPLMREPIRIRDGEAVVTDSPGSGFDPDATAVERFGVSPWEIIA